MANIIAFESNNLPAYLSKVNVAELNADLTSHASTGFPVISIKGKVFAVVRDGERTVLTKDIDGEKIPAPSIDVVLLKANKGTSKVFYVKGYTEGAEGVKPDCFSNTGDKPDASVEKPQAKTCATCPHNQWGSKVGDNGSKGKACQDSVRMAIATPDMLNDPYLLRVPPASIRSLGEYGDMLKKRGVGYNMVVTKVGFDMEAPTPKLTFKPVGFLDDNGFAQVQETLKSDVVKNILGGASLAQVEAAVAAAPAVEAPKQEAPVTPPVPPSKEVTDTEVKAAVSAAEAPAAQPKAAVKEELSVNLDLSDLSFDD
jgi:hypothetical protein